MARRVVAFIDVLGHRNDPSQQDLVEIRRRLQAGHTARPVFPKDQRRFDSDACYDPSEIGWQRVVNVCVPGGVHDDAVARHDDRRLSKMRHEIRVG
jgi:hypothetical protein